ncbi:MAG: hypothetical protein RMY36_032840 [Nostoc sp. SerVER01]|nr:hypothetical protein [Nostoc sp. SerVER01]
MKTVGIPGRPVKFVEFGLTRPRSPRGLRLMPFCTCNPMHGRAVYVHHVKYSRSPLRRLLGILLFHAPRKSLSGCEIIGYDAFPVCENCHHNVYGRSDRPQFNTLYTLSVKSQQRSRLVV